MIETTNWEKIEKVFGFLFFFRSFFAVFQWDAVRDCMLAVASLLLETFSQFHFFVLQGYIIKLQRIILMQSIGSRALVVFILLSKMS